MLPLNNIELFNIDLFDLEDFTELIIRFAFNLLVNLIIVKSLYYKIAKRKDYLFTYLLIGTTIFLLCFLLDNVKLQLGFALGLFAVFGIIRYRTNPIPIKEMTYLFVVIGVSIINALSNKKISYAELIFTNIAMIGVIFLLEKVWLLKHETQKNIVYERIDLIQPGKYSELKEDLENRTGLKINRIEIGNVDFLRDTAKIRIYYFEKDNQINQLETEGSLTYNE